MLIISSLGQQAINLILMPRENDIPELNRCRNTWKQTGDAESARRSIPRRWESSVEAQLLNGLVQLQKNDLVGALNRVMYRTWRILSVCVCESISFCNCIIF